ncbi:MAG: hypothetical protein BGO98_30255 [Myxococcales bacterium 68-20]|nr:MAG: hypothetical protein BGO98_30255 [Myxococcales bacterium 68-20]
MVADVRRERMWHIAGVDQTRRRGITPIGSRFVGRTGELASLTRCFYEGARLVTLIGPGGIGKTTLARELLAQRVAPEGARSGARALVVDLDGTTTLPELLDRVASVCGANVSDVGAVAVASVGAALDELGPATLVLDGFDGLVPLAHATVGAWTEHCVELEIVVTSREALGLVSEHVLEVGPMGLHQAEDAIAILVGAARRVAVGFMPRPEDTGALAEIVRVLDGVPLALDLAGARLPLVGARNLLADLHAGVRLQQGARGRPERHASTDAAVRGSFEALAAHEKDVLAQLTVFRGGFTAASAAAIVVVSSADASALDVLESLRARSLVRTRGDGARFDLYAQVRDFVVSERPSPIEAAASRHAAWFVTEAERAAERAHVEREARAWLLAERENVLEVARRVLGGGVPSAIRAEPAIRSLVAMRDVLLFRGPGAELAELVSPIVERTRDSGVAPKLSARVMLLRGAIQRERGDVRASLKDLLAAESIARTLEDELLGAEASLELGKTVRLGGELEAAGTTFGRAARMAGGVGARMLQAEATALEGATAGERGDVALARVLCERAVALAGDDRLAGARLRTLAARAYAELGDRTGARSAAESAERLAMMNGDLATAAEALVLSALAAHDAGDLEGASAVLARARDLFATIGHEANAAIARGHLGAIAREQGRSAEAYATLSDARDVLGRLARPAHAAYFGAHLAGLEAALGRHDAAAQILDRLVLEREADAWWPFSATACVEAQRAGAVTVSGTTLLARLFSRTVGAHAIVAPTPREDALVVGAGGAWFRPPHGTRVGLERRRSLALLLDHLAKTHVEQAGATVRAATLFSAAWPGEKAIASAAAHRVRVAVATLRKMGLRDCLVTTPEGYALTPALELVRA